MAVIYLRHPKHGAKVAISHAEAENDIENGWEQFDPTDPDSDLEVEPATEALSVNELQPRRRGRRPREATV